MIKANELRIGNWVQVDYYEALEYLQIASINNQKEYESYYPIPLTPEILEKCGFVKNGYGDYKHKNLYSVLTKSGTKKGLLLRQGDEKDEPVIEYLHQLQNLYFALTGTELEINLHVATTI